MCTIPIRIIALVNDKRNTIYLSNPVELQPVLGVNSKLKSPVKKHSSYPQKKKKTENYTILYFFIHIIFHVIEFFIK